MQNKAVLLVNDAREILKEYWLCNVCLGRLFSTRVGYSHYKLLGKRIRRFFLTTHHNEKCYICQNLSCDLDFFVKKLQILTKKIEFNSFNIGIILKNSFLERDDYIRSKFKLKGANSLKSGISQEISYKFQKLTKLKLDPTSPEITLIVNFKNNEIDFQLKPIYLFGRYIKKTRDLPQKSSLCKPCKGKGCSLCNYHGITSLKSIEGIISDFCYSNFVTSLVKVHFIGGEDKSNLVLGNGRPFFVKVINPLKRKIKLPSKIICKDIEIHLIKFIGGLPKYPISFKSTVKIMVESDVPIQTDVSDRLKTINQIKIYEKNGKIIEKHIKIIDSKIHNSSNLVITAVTDGGFPIKKFVQSNNVCPNLSDLLTANCTCKRIDFNKIILNHNN